jgi:hypothetical protein
VDDFFTLPGFDDIKGFSQFPDVVVAVAHDGDFHENSFGVVVFDFSDSIYDNGHSTKVKQLFAQGFCFG